jgi:hypothetical protein
MKINKMIKKTTNKRQIQRRILIADKYRMNFENLC